MQSSFNQRIRNYFSRLWARAPWPLCLRLLGIILILIYLQGFSLNGTSRAEDPEAIKPVEYEDTTVTQQNIQVMENADMTSAGAAATAQDEPGAGNNADRENQSAEAEKKLTLLEKLNSSEFRERLEKTSLIPIFKKGGPIMWPLLIISILAMGTVIDRSFFLFNTLRKRDTKAMDRFYEAIRNGDLEGAIRISNQSKYYLVRTLGFALSHRQKSLANALIYAQEQEMKRFRRGIPILDSIITLAPLLGLLGTVTGMMASFSLIGGELSAPGAITGGIAEALIATAYGLGIAITSLIPFNLLNTKLENARLEIETAATQLELLMHPQGAPKKAKSPKYPVRSGGEKTPPASPSGDDFFIKDYPQPKVKSYEK